MGIFKEKKSDKVSSASAPEEPESEEEIKHIEELGGSKKKVKEEVKEEVKPQEEIKYREVPVCMSQEQINNLIIENNLMLKQIISDMQ